MKRRLSWHSPFILGNRIGPMKSHRPYEQVIADAVSVQKRGGIKNQVYKFSLVPNSYLEKQRGSEPASNVIFPSLVFVDFIFTLKMYVWFLRELK